MRVVVGRIGRPHGIRGEVTVEPRTDEPDERFAPGAVFALDERREDLVVERLHWHSGRLLVTFEGISDRNAAEALRGTLLEVERADDDMPEDPEEFYDSTLIGCVVDHVDGSRIGEVLDVLHLPAQDLLVVRVAGEREALIPFVSVIVPVVDLPGRRLVVDPPVGLLDADEG
ncbi:MAG: ribosome maturation factor RimM [Actinomycetota bacterium]|nr:ribosome maturation factor RimM [Actinomycetota bacterium]